VHSGAVAVLNVHGDVAGPDNVDVPELDAGHLRRGRFGTQLERPSPIAPHDEPARTHIAHREVRIWLAV